MPHEATPTCAFRDDIRIQASWGPLCSVYGYALTQVPHLDSWGTLDFLFLSTLDDPCRPKTMSLQALKRSEGMRSLAALSGPSESRHRPVSLWLQFLIHLSLPWLLSLLWKPSWEMPHLWKVLSLPATNLTENGLSPRSDGEAAVREGPQHRWCASRENKLISSFSLPTRHSLL